MVNQLVTLIDELNLVTLNQGISELEIKYNLEHQPNLLTPSTSEKNNVAETTSELAAKENSSKDIFLVAVNTSETDEKRKELFSILSDILSLNRIQVKKKILTELPFLIKKVSNTDELITLKNKLEELGATLEIK